MSLELFLQSEEFQRLPAAAAATLACALATVAVLMGFRSLVRQIEANDKVTAKFDAAAAHGVRRWSCGAARA